jgi:hypothetical protein
MRELQDYTVIHREPCHGKDFYIPVLCLSLMFLSCMRLHCNVFRKCLRRRLFGVYGVGYLV